ncbi:hypothetical protein B0H34DRAFT_471259 [Crassisporium funariophilum]|nr:hypothetical protein B0H34DRAFT_471259 [Crassisporium funariophilum]
MHRCVVTVMESSALDNAPVVRPLKPTQSEITQAVAALADAFEGDPFTGVLVGGDLSLDPEQLRANIQGALVEGQQSGIHLARALLRPRTNVQQDGINTWKGFRKG